MVAAECGCLLLVLLLLLLPLLANQLRILLLQLNQSAHDAARQACSSSERSAAPGPCATASRELQLR